MILLTVLLPSIMVGVATIIISWFIGEHFREHLNVERISRKQLLKIEEQLPAFLDGLAASLSAGNSLQQSMTINVQKTTDPLLPFIQGILIQHQSGVSLEDALKAEAATVDTGTIPLALNSIAASYRSGSNMVEALSLLSSMCRERTNLRKKILARTAQSRMQGNVIVAVPLLFMVLLYLVSPGNMVPVLTSVLGRNILITALIFQATGAVLVRKILKQEIL